MEPEEFEDEDRVKGSTTATITRNEILYALNQAEKFRLAIVLVTESGTTEGPFYLSTPFTKEPDWDVSSINYDLSELLSRSTPCT
jgi:hypothetical protein